MLPALSDFIYHSFQLNCKMASPSPIPRRRGEKKKKKLYTGRIRFIPTVCTIGPIHYLLRKAKYKNKKKKKKITQLAELVTITWSSFSADKPLQKQ